MLKSSINEVPFNGIFSDSLQEMSLFQHLSYLSYDNNNNNSNNNSNCLKRRVFQLFFLEPLGFINLTRDTSSVEKEEGEGEGEGEGDEEDEDEENDDGEEMILEKEEEPEEVKQIAEETTVVPTSVKPASRWDMDVVPSTLEADVQAVEPPASRISAQTPATPVAAPFPSSLSAEKKEKEKPSSLVKQQQPKKSTSALPFIRCLLFAPVHISLSSLLERKISSSTSSAGKEESNCLVSPVLAMQWIVELMIIIDYLSNCGIALKYLSLEDIFITSEGTLKIGGLQGATMISSYHRSSLLKDEDKTSSSVEAVTGSLKKKKISKSSSLKEDEIWSGIIPLHQAYLTSPEVLFGDAVTYSSSIYCLGTIAYYLLTGKPLVKVREMMIVSPFLWLFTVVVSPAFLSVTLPCCCSCFLMSPSFSALALSFFSLLSHFSCRTLL
jgi:hypothetical protein